MKVTVYHLNRDHYMVRIGNGYDYRSDALAKEYMDITCLSKPEAIENAMMHDRYQAVAIASWVDEMEVEDALEAAWEMTNNIDQSWVGLHDNCTALAPAENGCRSSMVGDMFIVQSKGGQPERYAVAGVGFKKLKF